MSPPVVRRRVAALLICVGLVACGSSPPSVSPTLQTSVTATASHEATPTPTLAPSPTPRTFDPLEVVAMASIPAAEKGLPSLRAHTVASGHYPAGLSVAPDGRIFFTELYGGRINTIDAQGRTTTWYDVNAHFHIHWTQYYHGGLTAVTVDPDFTEPLCLRRQPGPEPFHQPPGDIDDPALHRTQRAWHGTHRPADDASRQVRQHLRPRLCPGRNDLHPIRAWRAGGCRGRG
jgi:hypothetical protein